MRQAWLPRLLLSRLWPARSPAALLPPGWRRSHAGRHPTGACHDHPIERRKRPRCGADRQCRRGYRVSACQRAEARGNAFRAERAGDRRWRRRRRWLRRVHGLARTGELLVLPPQSHELTIGIASTITLAFSLPRTTILAQVTLFPCGHNITCAGCTRALLQLKRPCPFCSTPIDSTDLERLPDAWQRR